MKKKYSILYLDPAWKYNSRANHKTRFRGGACGHYDLMTMEEIKALPIPELADDNCVLFMWCTFPYLEDQIKLFNHWGFKYKTVGFNWIKLNKNKGYKDIVLKLASGKIAPVVAYRLLIKRIKNNYKPFFGVGYYAKSNAEVCLMGIKGKMKPVCNSVSSAILSPREEHSKKPDECRKRIVKLFGDIPRLEMFARQNAKGWDAWGNQVEASITL